MIRWITGPEMRKCKVRGQRTREWEIRPGWPAQGHSVYTEGRAAD